MEVHLARLALLCSIPLLSSFGGCDSGMSETSVNVTDDPKQIGSYTSGDVYELTADIACRRIAGGLQVVQGTAPQDALSISKGTKLRISGALRVSGPNYSYVKVVAELLDGQFKGNPIEITPLSNHSGNVNIGGHYVTGPNPKYLQPAKK